MNNKEKKSNIKTEEIEIGKILNEWDPIHSSIDDEYICLTHHIISELHKGASEKAIESLIRDEIINHFGISEDEDEIRKVVSKIFYYWKYNTR
jgi:hypothetical protein